MRHTIAKLKKKIKSRKGFSLAEVLMAVMILLMVSSIVAAGIPVAVRAYANVSDSANAQVYLSDAMTRLRMELQSATDIEIDDSGKSIQYTNSIGSTSKIYLQDGELYISEYLDVDESSRPGKSIRPLVQPAAGGKKLYITFKTVGLNDSKKAVIFKGLVVKRLSEKGAENSLAGTDEDEYCIRLLIA